MAEIETLGELKDLSLPLYTSIALARLRAKTGELFTLVAGLSEDVALQLKKKSLDMSDIELQEKTSDYRRFGEGMYDEWYSKGRLPFALVDEKNNLAALTWFGPEPVPTDSAENISDISGEWDTTALRSYEPYRGKGIMRAFFEYAWNAYHALLPGRRLWLETNTDNAGILHLGEKLGFTNYGIRAKNGRILLVKE